LNFLPVFVVDNLQAIAGNTSKTGALAAVQMFFNQFWTYARTYPPA